MGIYSDILLTVDFDRTLTGPDAVVPERNIEAIAYFMANGGKFTVNTGRSTSTFGKYLDTFPVNAPLLLYNGSAAWENGRLTHSVPIELDVWQTMDTVRRLFPVVNLEIQGVDTHYLIDPSSELTALYDKLGWQYQIAQQGQDVGPFLKFACIDTPKKPAVSAFYECDESRKRYFDRIEQTLRSVLGETCEVFRACPLIVDIHAKGVSKINAARRLQAELGRRILVCVGDAENDIPMLDGADFAFCPADSVVAERYENVCPCGAGAVADVIYKKIPEILANQP